MNKGNQEYRQNLIRFSNKIDNWHEKIKLEKKGTFGEDDEFQHNDASPN